ncbi:hypothetical protein G7054_g11091 [Neopestalotiopsis clavispora]|nr:hypothetical protein G7054_g11091 [Neopestalotiopsis clavispora]
MSGVTLKLTAVLISRPWTRTNRGPPQYISIYVPQALSRAPEGLRGYVALGSYEATVSSMLRTSEQIVVGTEICLSCGSQGHFNMSGRSLSDAIVVIDVDDLPTDSHVVNLRVLSTPGFRGTNGDGLLNVVGFGATDDDKDGSIRLWIVNDRPSLDIAKGEFLDQARFGANATIELFRAGPNANQMKHLKTFSHEQIATPNRIAPVGGRTDAFYFTNDHGTSKVGWQHQLSPLLGTGDVSFCDGDACRKVVAGLKFPNGLTRGHDGSIYVPSSLLGTINVYQPQPGGDLIKLHTVETGYAIDNLRPDRDGHIFAAGITNGLKFYAAVNDPYNKNVPTVGLKITQDADGRYKVTKIVEDGLGEVLPGSTTVVHDVATGRIFLSGTASPYIAVCDPK